MVPLGATSSPHEEAAMRGRTVAIGMAMVVAATVATVAAQPRMTFQCHDPGAPVCDGRFVVNGTETFVRGVYDSGFSTPPTDGWESALFTGSGDVRYYRSLATVQINAYLNYYQGMDSLDQVRALLDVLGQHHVMWFQTANCSGDGSYTRYSPGFTVDRDGGYFAQQLATHSQMAGYYIMDECGDSSYGTDLVPETQYHHSVLKSPAFDPAAINFAVPVARGYRDPKFWTAPPDGDPNATSAPTADLFGTDPYPLYGSEPRTGYPHFEVADYIARLRDDIAADKPVVGVLQFFNFGKGGRLPTKPEMRMHAYAAIVEGAQGLFWWDIGENGIRSRTTKVAQITAAMQNLKDVTTELRTIEAALLAPPTPSALVDIAPRFDTPRAWRIAALRNDIPLISNYADKQWYQAELTALTASAPDESLSPMLHQAAPQRSNIRTRISVVSGVGYVIAYNYSNTAIKGATFTWQTVPSEIDVLAEGRTITPVSATFKDDFAPYEAHVYIVR
jgi:hypothetical protein